MRTRQQAKKKMQIILIRKRILFFFRTRCSWQRDKRKGSAQAELERGLDTRRPFSNLPFYGHGSGSLPTHVFIFYFFICQLKIEQGKTPEGRTQFHTQRIDSTELSYQLELQRVVYINL